jgi:hypothetical protein
MKFPYLVNTDGSILQRTQFSSDGAKKELVDLFERAKVTSKNLPIRTWPNVCL